MAIYALSTLPLISKISQENLTQTWFADDACGGASIQALHQWLTELSQEGPKFGYHVNPPKTWLLAKEEHLEKPQALFHSCGINVTTEGRPLLGAPIGTQCYSSEFIQEQVSQWVAEVKTLSSVAKTRPQAAYAAYTHGLAGKWTYLSRACEISSEQLSDLEEVIRLDFIPAISGHAVSDIERILLALPARMGGLGLPNQRVMRTCPTVGLGMLPGRWLIVCSAGMKDRWRRSWKFSAMRSRPTRGPRLAGWMTYLG